MKRMIPVISVRGVAKNLLRGQTRGSGGRKSPAGPATEYRSSREHQWGLTKIDLR